MGSTTELVLRGGGGGSTSVRVPEDILRNTRVGATAAEQTSPLVSRGRAVDQWNRVQGFRPWGQHFQGSGLSRTPLFPDDRSGGLTCIGRGPESDGYGASDGNAGAYARYARDYLDCYWTFSGRFQLRSEVPGAVDSFTMYFDTQTADNSARQFPAFVFSPSDSKWKINIPGSFVTVPGLTGLILGDNEGKMGSMYVAFSYYHASDITQSHYGHVQVGGVSVDVRTLGAAGKPDTPQVGIVPFGMGLNIGIGASTPLAGKAGGWCMDRGELTVGDVLYV